jgi:hypothetical protein
MWKISLFWFHNNQQMQNSNLSCEINDAWYLVEKEENRAKGEASQQSNKKFLIFSKMFFLEFFESNF